jgi:hypothetical protein
MDKQVKQIVKVLIKKSKKNKVAWRREGHNKFYVILSMGTIHIKDGLDFLGYYRYYITVFNHKDELVFDKCADNRVNKSYFDLLEELYYCAREASLGVRQLFESMLADRKSVV